MASRRRRFRGLTARELRQQITAVHSKLTVDGTVQAVVDAVVRTAGFGVAAVSVSRPDSQMQTVAVAGSISAREHLLGVRKPRQNYEDEFAIADRWGTLLFVPHDRVPDAALRGWVPEIGSPKRRRGWHPLDALYAPLRNPAGELVGVLSVDLPSLGRQPGRQQRELLEALAVQAGIAIDNARLTEQLRASEQMFRLAFDGAGTGLGLLSTSDDLFGRYLRVNPTFCAIVGRTQEQLLTMTATELTHPDDRAEDKTRIQALISNEIPVYRTEKRYLRADNSSVWVSVTVTQVKLPDGSVDHAISQIEDITVFRARRKELQHGAYHDRLTNIPNRAALLVRLDQALATSQQTGRPGSLLFIDLDGFKRINDRHGHLMGDHALSILAARLDSCVGTAGMVARWGGDEFIVVRDDVDSDSAAELSRRISNALAEPIDLGGMTISVTASIGAAEIPVGPAVPADLLHTADQAMYTAKRKKYPAVEGEPA